MTESTKTLSFVGAAALLLIGAWVVRPRPIAEAQDDIGQEFFAEFRDPNAATSLEVVEYDKESGGLRPFKVAEVNGIWSIPSHEGYPADAKNQLEQAAAGVIGLTKLSLVSESPGDHEMYGVLDPEDSKAEGSGEGMGKRITLEDKSGHKLAQFIIGKADPDKPELHFVRVPGQDRVYRALVKTDKLSTKFQNWIEEDLLKLNAFDVKEVVLDDHSVDEANQTIIQRGVAVVDFDNKESKWKLVDMKALDEGSRQWQEVKLADDEELDSQKLNDLKTALDDLKIVDVAHKPQGLSKELKAGEELLTDRATRIALQQKGFYLVPTQQGAELFSNEGEIRCGLTDGVEYVLRFGEIAGQGTGDDEEEAGEKSAADKPKDAGADKDASKDKGVNRYIMVTARFREDLVPKPDLQPLPEGVELPPEEEPAKPADESATESKDDAKAAADEAKPATEEPKTEAPKDEAAQEPAAAAEPPKSDESAASNRRFEPGDENLLALAETDAAQPAADAPKEPNDAVKTAETKAAVEQPAGDQPATETPAGDQPAAEKKAEPVDADAAAEAAEKAQGAKLVEAKRIREDNKRKEEEYRKKVENGEKRVKELNERFADWYYVISDSTYKKIHVGRDQLIKKKAEPAAEGAMPPAGINGLQGLQGLPPGFPQPR